MIGQFMSTISENSGLSVMYTNHCIRGTTATAMHHSGYSLQDIKFVTCYKNIESLKFYFEQPTISDMENYSDLLFQYTDKDTKAKGKKNTKKQYTMMTLTQILNQHLLIKGRNLLQPVQ